MISAADIPPIQSEFKNLSPHRMEADPQDQIRGPQTVSYIKIQITPIVTLEKFSSETGQRTSYDRLTNLIKKAIHALDGKILYETDECMEAIFFGPAGVETTPLRSTYVATRVISDLQQHFSDNSTKSAYKFALSIALSTSTGGVVDIMSNDGMIIVSRAKNIADNIIQYSGKNEVVLCEETVRVISTIFKCELINVSTDCKAYHLGPRYPAPRHFEIRVHKGLSPLIGRDGELEFLKKKWHNVRQGDIQSLALRGELGSGKSRMAYELEKYVSKNGGYILHIDCNYIFRNTAYYPIRTLLERILDLEDGMSYTQRTSQVASFMRKYNQDIETYDIALSLVLDIEDSKLINSTYGTGQSSRLFNQLTKLLRFICGSKPTLTIVEDVEWIDNYTAEFLSLNNEIHASNGHLLMLTIGSPNQLPAPLRSVNTLIELGPLSRKQCDLIFDALDTDEQITSEMRTKIRKTSNAIPLYFEELIRGELELTRSEISNNTSLPISVWSFIEKHLRTTNYVASTVHCAALIGTQFSAKLLHAIDEKPIVKVNEELAALVDKNILTQNTDGKPQFYDFRHALIRRAFLNSIPEKQRVIINLKLATILSGIYAKNFDFPADVIGQFWVDGGRPEKSIPHFLTAAKAANQTAAYSDAEMFIRKALDELKKSNTHTQTTELELELLIELASTLTRHLGVESDQANSAWMHAYDCSLKCNNREQKFRISWGLWSMAMGRSDFRRAQALSDQVSRESNRLNHKRLRIEADHCCWTTCHLTGRLKDAKRYIDQGLKNYSMVEHSKLAESFGGHDPGVCCRTIGGIVCYLMGEPDKAFNLSRQGLEMAVDLSHSGSIAQALLGAMDVALLEDNPKRVKLYGNWLLEVSENERYFDYRAIAEIFLGWARVKLDNDNSGILQMKNALIERQITGGIGLPLQTWLLCDAQFHVGLFEDVEEYLTMANKNVQATGEKWWQAELVLMDIRLINRLQTKDEDKIDALINKGRSISAKQGAGYFIEKFNALK